MAPTACLFAALCECPSRIRLSARARRYLCSRRAVLVSAFGWSPVPVVLVITLGGVIGSWIDFRIGLWLIKTNKLDRFGESGRKSIDKLVAQMHKRGAAYLVLNRFLPGVRAFFFVAAGIAGLSLGSVLLWSAVSALLWNIGLVALGYAVGSNLDELTRLLSTYGLVAWIVIGAIAAFFIGRAIYRKLRTPKEPPEGANQP